VIVNSITVALLVGAIVAAAAVLIVQAIEGISNGKARSRPQGKPPGPTRPD
jgi:hypothetical protein